MSFGSLGIYSQKNINNGTSGTIHFDEYCSGMINSSAHKDWNIEVHVKEERRLFSPL